MFLKSYALVSLNVVCVFLVCLFAFRRCFQAEFVGRGLDTTKIAFIFMVNKKCSLRSQRTSLEMVC